jgi:aminoglycoside 6'-N-acetyltransferase
VKANTESHGSVTLRAARREDVALLRRWDEAPHIVASDPNDDWQWEIELGRDVDWREQWIAEVGGAPIGFLEIIDPEREEGRYWGDVPAGLRAIDIWIGEAAELNKGYGTQMMRFGLARCFSNEEVDAVLVDPLANNLRARKFYERLGFQWIERRQFGEDDCMVYRLTRGDWERLEEKRS